MTKPKNWQFVLIGKKLGNEFLNSIGKTHLVADYNMASDSMFLDYKGYVNFVIQQYADFVKLYYDVRHLVVDRLPDALHCDELEKINTFCEEMGSVFRDIQAFRTRLQQQQIPRDSLLDDVQQFAARTVPNKYYLRLFRHSLVDNDIYFTLHGLLIEFIEFFVRELKKIIGRLLEEGKSNQDGARFQAPDGLLPPNFVKFHTLSVQLGINLGARIGTTTLT